MTLRAILTGGLIAAIAALAAVLAFSGGGGYTVRLRLSDAGGLRNGSKVVEGGVQVGTVALKLGAGDAVLATLHIDHAHAPIGRDATAQIVSLNLLGQKSLRLEPGDRSRPARSGSTLTAAVTPATDLDQVLDVLASDTRARLSVLIDEAGTAFTGRRADFSALLGELPDSLSAGADLLAQLDGQNGTLADLVAHSDRFITRLSAQRTQLAALVGTLGQAATTVEPRDAQLGQTLQRLPGTLATAQRFLARLRATTVPLGPAARDIETVAAPLDQTLAQVAPFTAAARPALSQATDDAPELSALATRATPVLRSAAPTLGALSTAAADLRPVSGTLDHSVDNIIATAWNWSHAVELRDGLSHLFRAELSFSPATVDFLVSKLLTFGAGSSASATPSRAKAPAHGAGNGSRPAAHPTSAAPAPASTTTASTPAPAPTATTPTTTSTTAGSGLAGLLHFLTGQ